MPSIIISNSTVSKKQNQASTARNVYAQSIKLNKYCIVYNHDQSQAVDTESHSETEGFMWYKTRRRFELEVNFFVLGCDLGGLIRLLHLVFPFIIQAMCTNNVKVRTVRVERLQE